MLLAKWWGKIGGGGHIFITYKCRWLWRECGDIRLLPCDEPSWVGKYSPGDRCRCCRWYFIWEGNMNCATDAIYSTEDRCAQHTSRQNTCTSCIQSIPAITRCHYDAKFDGTWNYLTSSNILLYSKHPQAPSLLLPSDRQSPEDTHRAKMIVVANRIRIVWAGILRILYWPDWRRWRELYNR